MDNKLIKKIQNLLDDFIMENKIKQLEEDVYKLERKVKWKQKVQKPIVL